MGELGPASQLAPWRLISRFEPLDAFVRTAYPLIVWLSIKIKCWIARVPPEGISFRSVSWTNTPHLLRAMNYPLLVASVLAFGVGIGHSVVGERFILIPLLKRTDLPKLFGSDTFTKRTLHFAWHLTTIAWWGFAAILALLARQTLSPETVLRALAATFGMTTVVTFAGSRGRHLAWIAFLIIALICLWSAQH
jgi:hypothetical protein